MPKYTKKQITDLLGVAQNGNAEEFNQKLNELKQRGEIDWSQLTDGGWTPLHFAVQENNIPVIDLLLKTEIDINAQTKSSGTTALHKAVMDENVLVVEKLLTSERIDLNVKTKDRSDKQTALHLAVLIGNKQLANLLINRGANVNEQDKNGIYPIFYALQNGDEEMFNYLIEMGAKFDVTDSKGRTGLHFLAGSKMTTENAGKLTNMFNVLIDAGVNINAKTTDLGHEGFDIDAGVDTSRNSDIQALHIAAESNNLVIARLLIAHKANVNAQEGTHLERPINMAVRGNHLEMVQLLIEEGADLDRNDRGGRTPFDQAEGEIRDLIEKELITKEQKPQNKQTQIDTIFAAAKNKEQKPQKRIYTQTQIDTIFAAAKNDEPKPFRKALRALEKPSFFRRAKPISWDEIKNDEGLTIMQWAVDNDKQEVVEILRKKGATIPEKTPQKVIAEKPVAKKPEVVSTQPQILQPAKLPEPPTPQASAIQSIIENNPEGSVPKRKTLVPPTPPKPPEFLLSSQTPESNRQTRSFSAVERVAQEANRGVELLSVRVDALENFASQIKETAKEIEGIEDAHKADFEQEIEFDLNEYKKFMQLHADELKEISNASRNQRAQRTKLETALSDPDAQAYYSEIIGSMNSIFSAAQITRSRYFDYYILC